MYHEYIPKNSNEIVFALKIKQGVHKGKNTKFLPQFFFSTTLNHLKEDLDQIT